MKIKYMGIPCLYLFTPCLIHLLYKPPLGEPCKGWAPALPLVERKLREVHRLYSNTRSITMSTEPENDLWRYVVVKAIILCNNVTWAKETKRDIWHRVVRGTPSQAPARMYCGARVEYTSDFHITELHVAPPEQNQCIICQFELEHLSLFALEKAPTKPTKPRKPKPPVGGPESPYTPNPPAMRLQVPVAQAA